MNTLGHNASDSMEDRQMNIFLPFQIDGNVVRDSHGTYLFEAADHEMAHILVDTFEYAIAVCELYPDNKEKEIVYVN